MVTKRIKKTKNKKQRKKETKKNPLSFFFSPQKTKI